MADISHIRITLDKIAENFNAFLINQAKLGFIGLKFQYYKINYN